jgi:hypothetical protein
MLTKKETVTNYIKLPMIPILKTIKKNIPKFYLRFLRLLKNHITINYSLIQKTK